MSGWKWRLFLFVRAVDATAVNRNALAAIYVNNGSGETLADELKMFNSMTRLSTTGAEPAQVFGLNLTAQTAMRDEFVALVSGLTQPAWAVLANTTLPNYADGEVVAVSSYFPAGAVGTIVTWQDALDYLAQRYGLQVIPDPDPITGGAPTVRTLPA